MYISLIYAKSTPYPKPETRNPEPGTRNPEHGTQNAELGTRNAERGTSSNLLRSLLHQFFNLLNAGCHCMQFFCGGGTVSKTFE